MSETSLLTAWTGGRTPVQDPEAEGARTRAYWAWLDAQPPAPSRATPLCRDGAFTWVRLVSPLEADFEARHMRHSIGKYGSLGEIYSLRAADGTPVATVLAISGRIVHAREHQNARLGAEAGRRLERFAAHRGLDLVPDELPFDVGCVPGLPGTELRLCQRQGLQQKRFDRLVLPGDLDAGQAARLAQCLGGNRLDLAAADLSRLTALKGPGIEVVALLSSPEPAREGAPALATVIDRLQGAGPEFGA